MRLTGLLLGLIFTAAALFAAPLPDGSSVTMKETVVQKLPNDSTPIFNADGTRIALLVADKQQYLLYEGKKSPLFDSLTAVFSPGGKHLFYVALRGKTMVIAIDGVAQPADVRDVSFSSDDAHVAYIVANKDKQCVRTDGKDGPLFDTISAFHWSPSSKRCCYIAGQGEQECLVVDGTAGSEKYDAGTTRALFSPDDQQLAVCARHNGKWALSLDGVVKAGGYDDLVGPFFSAGGKHLAVIAHRGTAGDSLIMDGVEGAWYARVDSFHFSPDGLHYTYNAQKSDGSCCVVEDGKELQGYPITLWPSFSPDSKRLGYVVWSEQAEKLGRTFTKGFVVVDGKASQSYDKVLCPGQSDGILFSPDSQRWVFPAKYFWATAAEAKAHANYPDQDLLVTSEGTEYRHEHASEIDTDSLAFSPDSRHLVYFIYGGESGYKGVALCIDGVQVTDFFPTLFTDATVRFPIFSAPNKLFFYVCKETEEASLLVKEEVTLTGKG